MGEFEDEFDGVELSRSVNAFKKCKHVLFSEIKEELTFDARKRTIKETRCRKCNTYYTLEVLSEEKVSDEAILR